MCERLVVQGGMAKVYHSVDQIAKVYHSFDQISNFLPLFLPRVANQSTAKLAELLYSIATLYQPLRDSATIGTKAVPHSLHSSSVTLHLLLKATVIA